MNDSATTTHTPTDDDSSDHHDLVLENQGFKLWSSCKKLMRRHPNKIDTKKEDDAELNDCARTNHTPTDDDSSHHQHYHVLDSTLSQRYLRIINELDQEAGYLESNMLENEFPLRTFPAWQYDSEDEAHDWSHQYLRKSTPIRRLSHHLDKSQTEHLRTTLSKRDVKRRERQSNRLGIPGVIVLGQPLLPAKRERPI